MRRPALASFLVAVVLAGCASGQVRRTEQEPDVAALTEAQIAKLIPSKVPERRGWAEDIVRALSIVELRATPKNACSVMAVIEQESGYRANPTVAGLSGIIEKRISEYTRKLGPLGEPLLDKLLEGRAAGTDKTFRQRIKTVRTERDVDILFRDILAYYRGEFPNALAIADVLGGLFTSSHLEDLNPITTAGSMQVSVRFSAEVGEKRGMTTNEVRNELYTREGGVRYGTMRLFGYAASYADPVYRFADYNAGMYSSRNAELQRELTELTGIRLTYDGDLLAYNRAGEPADKVTKTLQALLAFRKTYAKDLSERDVRDDVKLEKREDFEATETWAAVKKAWQKKKGKKPPYARIPEVVIKSPKMSRERNTNWFAQSVNKRYQSCMSRVRKLAPVAVFDDTNMLQLASAGGETQ